MGIQVTIANKRATVSGAPVIVCGNSGYTVNFTFDKDWDGMEYKTARFVYVQAGEVKYQDVVFAGTTAEVPVMANTKEVRVGVFAGELRTSTPAVIPCELSIRCGTGAPDDPTPSQYDQIMTLLLSSGTGTTFITDETLRLADGELGVNVTEDISEGNNLPVTAGAVYDGINKVPTVPLKIRILGTETSCIQNIIGHKYTAADLYELAQTRDIMLESYGTANYQTLYGYYRYAHGSETAVVFDGWYENPNGRIVPARATIDANGSVSIARKTFAEGTVKTDTSLTISGSAADARAVGGEIESLKEIYSRVVTPGVENTGKLLYVDESGNGSFLQLGDGLEIVNGRLCITGTVTPDEPDEPYEPDTPVEPDDPAETITFTQTGENSVAVSGVVFEQQEDGTVLWRGATFTPGEENSVVIK